MTLGPYASFIVWSYAVCALVVAILIVWVALDYRRQQAKLRALDAAGVSRRSKRNAAEVS